MRFVINGDDIAFTPEGRLLVRNGFGSMWIEAVLGEDDPRRFGGGTHEVTPEERSRLEHFSRLGNMNPITGRHNRTNVMRTDYGNGWSTLTLHPRSTLTLH